MSKRGQVLPLDYRQIDVLARFTYVARMGNPAFRERVLSGMGELGWSKAELARRAGVEYHTLDKFLKGVNKTTSAENAQKLARALGINVDDDAEYQELRRLFYEVPEEERTRLLDTFRLLVAGMRSSH